MLPTTVTLYAKTHAITHSATFGSPATISTISFSSFIMSMVTFPFLSPFLFHTAASPRLRVNLFHCCSVISITSEPVTRPILRSPSAPSVGRLPCSEQTIARMSCSALSHPRLHLRAYGLDRDSLPLGRTGKHSPNQSAQVTACRLSHLSVVICQTYSTPYRAAPGGRC